MVGNSIRLINRQGQNGWDFAKAASVDAPEPNAGRLVYAPAFSPDGAQVVYQRFLGYQVLVDINLSQIAGSFDGGGQVLADGAGWLLPARFAPMAEPWRSPRTTIAMRAVSAATMTGRCR